MDSFTKLLSTQPNYKCPNETLFWRELSVFSVSSCNICVDRAPDPKEFVSESKYSF